MTVQSSCFRTVLPVLTLVLTAAALGGASGVSAQTPGSPGSPSPAYGPVPEPREGHLRALRQLTNGGENAEGYWSPDGQELIFQSQHPPFACDQIFRLRPPGPDQPDQPPQPVPEPALVSTGKGRTT